MTNRPFSMRMHGFSQLHAPSRTVLSLITLSCAIFSSLACGAKQEAAKDAKSILANDDEELAAEDGVGVMQEFGGLNEEKVTRIFKRLSPDLGECLTSAGADREYMAGKVEFLVIVGQDGEALSAHMERSNLGNYQAERCMLDILSASHWPKPVGGLKARARNGMEYDPGVVRAPVDWQTSDVEAVLSEEGNAATMAGCGGGGPFNITAYIGTDGRVLSAGVAHSDENGIETASCLLAAIEEMTFDSPGSWPAKVSFRR